MPSRSRSDSCSASSVVDDDQAHQSWMLPGSLGPISPAFDADRIVRAVMIFFDL
ncbi:hypothetical protein AB0J63_07470 [Streptosporangium canum]|uniref:hypothetical protein n=1 Tax=Streptosporangium canum TaxID=324952 RepID=UPI00341BB07F